MSTFRAARRFVVIPKGTEQEIVYQPGDVVPDFGQWGEVVRRAHLGQGNIVMDLPIGMGQAVSAAVAEEPSVPPAVAKKKRGKKAMVDPEPAAPCGDGDDDDACDGSDETAPINQGPGDGDDIDPDDEQGQLDEPVT